MADMRLIVAVVTVSLNDYRVESGIYIFHLFRGIGDIYCCYVVFQVLEAAASWNRNNPRFLIKDPGDGHLCRGYVFLFRDRLYELYEDHICLNVFLLEARY